MVPEILGPCGCGNDLDGPSGLGDRKRSCHGCLCPRVWKSTPPAAMLSEGQIFFFFFLIFVVVAISWAAPTAYGVSQARGSNRSCSHRPTLEPQQRRIRAVSAIYTTAHGNARSLNH